MTRLQRVIENMKNAALPCTLVSDPYSIFYLTGRMIHPGERMLTLVIEDSGKMTLVCNRLFAQSESELFILVEYDDTEDCVDVLSRYIPDYPAGTKIGIDKNWRAQFLLRLMQKRSSLVPVLGSFAVDNARALKDTEEADRMRRSSCMNDEAVKRLIETIREGDRECDLAQRYTQIALSLGAQGVSFSPLICFGANGAEPHHDTDSTPLQKGDMIILDVGLSLDGYMSDMTRTVVLGRASEEQKEVYELVRRANEAAKCAVRTGVPLNEIDAAARNVISAAGYGERFIHRTGHGIGLEVHEGADVSASSKAIAQEGMIFSIEPGIYLPGKFGVRIEDLVMVTKDGCECLNSLSRELIEL